MSPVYSVAFSPDGKTLVSTHHDNTIRLWDYITGTTLRTLGGHTSTVYSVSFSPDGQLLASAMGKDQIPFGYGMLPQARFPTRLRGIRRLSAKYHLVLIARHSQVQVWTIPFVYGMLPQAKRIKRL